MFFSNDHSQQMMDSFTTLTCFKREFSSITSFIFTTPQVVIANFRYANRSHSFNLDWFFFVLVILLGILS